MQKFIHFGEGFQKSQFVLTKTLSQCGQKDKKERKICVFKRKPFSVDKAIERLMIGRYNIQTDRQTDDRQIYTGADIVIWGPYANFRYGAPTQ